MNGKVIERDGKTYVQVCSSSDVRRLRGTKAALDDFTDVALFRVEGQCYALSNVCPHQHHQIIAEGFIDRDTVVCPMHGWQFKIKSGEEITQLGRIKTFDTIEEDGVVYVAYNKDDIPAWMK